MTDEQPNTIQPDESAWNDPDYIRVRCLRGHLFAYQRGHEHPERADCPECGAPVA